MISVIIIDDEQSALKSMQWEIANFCDDVIILGSFSNALEAKKFLNENVVDCVFLDIEMPEMDGFQFLDSFKNRHFSVVITTAYDQYAIKAIKEKALDYLLKPIDSDDLKSCIEKIRQHKEEHSIHDRLERTLETMVQKNHNQIKKISVSCDGKIIFLNPDDIVYCESDGNYCSIFLENKEKIFITQKLKFMEEKLQDLYFFRIHNSYLINLNKVKEFHKSDDFVVLSNHVKLPVSRNKKSNFLDQL
ncbi:LytTR family DNA-binding domain-containing protein [Flavobacterium sp.]|uniref:LytR/AlgR family response regulator transcription factor n=1 Tax=Flavobacterium sp. TaxID=239 RepID=UPI002B4AC1D8|nr:LytTR family DNA-binding domain-containing protein [Flavobacterium sp.]HLP64268.1 LytTR family DNA-binding domain-containing protein [Flavobacterium sp.]